MSESGKLIKLVGMVALASAVVATLVSLGQRAILGRVELPVTLGATLASVFVTGQIARRKYY